MINSIYLHVRLTFCHYLFLVIDQQCVIVVCKPEDQCGNLYEMRIIVYNTLVCFCLKLWIKKK
jgi:hypothetical protein